MNFLWAFLVGGALCAAGQLLIDLTPLTPARILTGYVVAGVVLSAVGLYGPLADFAGAGASVPLLGFGHLLAPGRAESRGRTGAARHFYRRPDRRGGRHHGQPCLRHPRRAHRPQQRPELNGAGAPLPLAAFKTEYRPPNGGH